MRAPRTAPEEQDIRIGVWCRGRECTRRTHPDGWQDPPAGRCDTWKLAYFRNEALRRSRLQADPVSRSFKPSSFHKRDDSLPPAVRGGSVIDPRNRLLYRGAVHGYGRRCAASHRVRHGDGNSPSAAAEIVRAVITNSPGWRKRRSGSKRNRSCSTNTAAPPRWP